MTPKQRRSLARYTTDIAKGFGLGGWTLIFPPEPPSIDETGAMVDTTYGRRVAHIRFADEFPSFPPEEQRHMVIHELLHIHFAHELQTVQDLLGSMGREAQAVAGDAYRLGHEYGIDAIADAIADFYPLWEG